MWADAAQSDEPTIGLEDGAESVVSARGRRYPAELARLFGGERSLDPQEGLGHLCIRVERFHELGVLHFEHPDLKPIGSEFHRWTVHAQRPGR
jgi:hypothetical protein